MKPIEGEEYWVTNGEAVWVAQHDRLAAGGWTNLDTWEDFRGWVIAWKHIPRPTVEEVLAAMEGRAG